MKKSFHHHIRTTKRNKHPGLLLLASQGLEALAMHNSGTGFIVFLLGNPHLLEGGQGGQDGATNPDGVFSFWRSNNLDLDGGGSQGGDFLLHTIGNT